MTRVVVGAYRVAPVPWAAGHFWMYAQYLDGLRRLGCDVWWLEELPAGAGTALDETRVETLRERLRPLGLADRMLLYRWGDPDAQDPTYLTCSARQAEQALAGAELLLNFHYEMRPALLTRFRRTALVDIDPGMLQLWWRQGHLRIHEHDRYLTIGEHLAGSVPGVTWVHTAPPVSLDLWPYRYDPTCEAFTSVSSWRTGAYVALDGHTMLDSNKRVSYLDFADLPRRTEQPLELAYVLLRNAWVSDRTVCYLASGKPAVVQDTGPSSYLPDDCGLLRFSTVDQAAAALDEVAAHYERHCRAAREIAAACFSATGVVTRILGHALD